MIDVSRHFGKQNGTVHLNPKAVAFSTFQHIPETKKGKKITQEHWLISLVVSGNAPMNLKFFDETKAKEFQSEYL